MTFRVEEIDAGIGSAWNGFLADVPAGTYCHRYEWKPVIESTYCLSVQMLAVHDANRWRGVFPVVVMPSLLGRPRRAVSVAFCGYGGLVCAAETDEADEVRMQAAVLEYLQRGGVGKVETRLLGTQASEANDISLILPLPAFESSLWRSVGDKVRNQVRKAKKKGLVAQWGKDQIGELYDVYAANMGRLGTPVHARAFFEAIVREFGGDADVLTVRVADKVIGAMLLIRHGDTWADPFASSLPGYQQYNPNMLLYWEALRSACEHGAKSFDFGRSQSGSGTDKFKRQWGAVAYPLEYRTFIDGTPHAIASTQLYRGRMGGVVSRVWARLPNGVQLRLGPKLRRHIP